MAIKWLGLSRSQGDIGRLKPGQGGGKHIRHEHLAPWMKFSVPARLQVQCRALSRPQEHLAWAAQTQPEGEVWQQVVLCILNSPEWNKVNGSY